MSQGPYARTVQFRCAPQAARWLAGRAGFVVRAYYDLTMTRISWPTAAVIIAVVAGVITLAAMGRDATALGALGVAIFTALGLGVGQVSQVKDQTNGANSQLVQLVRELAHRGYDAIPASTVAAVPAVAALPDTPGPQETAQALDTPTPAPGLTLPTA